LFQEVAGRKKDTLTIAHSNDRLLKPDNFVLTLDFADWTGKSAEATARVIATNIK
jgi:hypothetical protein